MGFVYSCPAPGTISPVKFRMTIPFSCLRHGMPILSTNFLLIRGVEHPVSRRAWMVAWLFVPQCTTIFTIGRLPQSGFSVDFSGEADGPASSFLRCLSCDVPALGSSGPFRFRDNPQIIVKASGRGKTWPFKNPTLPMSRPRRGLPACPNPRL